MRTVFLALCSLAVLNAQPASPRRFVDSAIPSLDYGKSCWSSIRVQNLGDRTVTIQVQAHRASGALVPLNGQSQMTIWLSPGETLNYRLEADGEIAAGSGWIKIREEVPSPDLSPVVAVSAQSECVVSNKLLSAAREIAFPTRNPWFSSEVDEMHGNIISMVNLSERPARATLCYSSGNLYSVPGKDDTAAELKPICSNEFEVQIPPFGTRQFPVERDQSSHFSMKTQGDAVILQMLHPVEAGSKVYTVDSTIRFEGESTK